MLHYQGYTGVVYAGAFVAGNKNAAPAMTVLVRT
jgi:hypothetical protein